MTRCKPRLLRPSWVHKPEQGIDLAELRKDLHGVAVEALHKAACYWNPAKGAVLEVR